jgi:hypothetical protein
MLAWQRRSDRLSLSLSLTHTHTHTHSHTHKHIAGDISVWDAEEKMMALSLSAGSAYPRVHALVPSPDGNLLMAACANAPQTSSLLLTYSLRTGGWWIDGWTGGGVMCVCVCVCVCVHMHMLMLLCIHK